MTRRRRRRKQKYKWFRLIMKKPFLFSLFIIAALFGITNVYFSKPVTQYAQARAKMYISVIINDAISREVVPNINAEDMVHFETTRSDGHITSVIIDVFQINNVLTKMTKDVQQRIANEVIKEELVMPMGVIFQHPLLNNVGPDIHIQIQMIGNVETDIVTQSIPYGINNTLMKIMIYTRVNFLVLIPFQSEEIYVETYTPLFIKVIQGQVPQYYYSSTDGAFINPPRDNYMD